MPESAVIPRSLTIRKIVPNKAGSLDAYIYIRENVRTKTVTDIDGEEHTLYEYDEVQVQLPLPAGITNRIDMRGEPRGQLRAVMVSADGAARAAMNAHLNKPDTPVQHVRGRRQKGPADAAVRAKARQKLSDKNEWGNKQLPPQARVAISATPAAEALAEELGMSLMNIEGSGAGGRILMGDVEMAASG